MSAIITFILIVAAILGLAGAASWLARRRWRNEVTGRETDAELEGRKTD